MLPPSAGPWASVASPFLNDAAPRDLNVNDPLPVPFDPSEEATSGTSRGVSSPFPSRPAKRKQEVMLLLALVASGK